MTMEEGDYFGDPVVEAARLSAVAEGDQILTTDVVKSLRVLEPKVFVSKTAATQTPGGCDSGS